MPLRAKSAFQMASSQAGGIDPDASDLLKELLQDDPRRLNLDGIPETAAEPEAIKEGLQHRDEARQYASAKALMALPRAAQLDQIDALRSSLGSDYGVHYLLASCTGLLELHERSDLVRDASGGNSAAICEIPRRRRLELPAAWNYGIKQRCWRRSAAPIPGSRCSGAAVKWQASSFLNRSRFALLFFFLFCSANLY